MAWIKLLALLPMLLSAGKLEKYRFPELTDQIGEWARDPYKIPYFVQVDMNGDNTRDSAWIMIRRGDTTGALVLMVSGKTGFDTLVYDLIESPQSKGIELLEKGKHPTLCGKEGRCFDTNLKTLNMKYDGVLYYFFGSSTRMIYWDEKEGKVKDVWESD